MELTLAIFLGVVVPVALGWVMGVAATWIGYRIARSISAQSFPFLIEDEGDEDGGWGRGDDDGPNGPSPVIVGEFTGNGRA